MSLKARIMIQADLIVSEQFRSELSEADVRDCILKMEMAFNEAYPMYRLHILKHQSKPRRDNEN